MSLFLKLKVKCLRTKNFGRKSLNEIKEILTQMGLGLGMKVDSIMKQVQENNVIVRRKNETLKT